jgi:hypothetical protein
MCLFDRVILVCGWEQDKMYCWFVDLNDMSSMKDMPINNLSLFHILTLISYLCYLYFIFMYMHNNHCHRVTAHLQLNILLLLLLFLYYYYYIIIILLLLLLLCS